MAERVKSLRLIFGGFDMLGDEVGSAWGHLAKTLGAGSGYQAAADALRLWSRDISEAVIRAAYTLWDIAKTIASQLRGYFGLYGDQYDDGGVLGGGLPELETSPIDIAPYPETFPGGVLFPHGRAAIQWRYTIRVTENGRTTGYVTGRTDMRAKDAVTLAIVDMLEHLESLRQKYGGKGFSLVVDSISEVV